jgi:hypothetical protein
VNFLITALACDLAADDEPMKIVVVGNAFSGLAASMAIFC